MLDLFPGDPQTIVVAGLEGAEVESHLAGKSMMLLEKDQKGENHLRGEMGEGLAFPRGTTLLPWKETTLVSSLVRPSRTWRSTM